MKNFLISSSILSADFSQLGKDIASVISAGADIVHFDVMDNHYVPNLGIGPMVLRSVRNYGINVPFEVHLMINPIEDYLIREFATVGANIIHFHPETSKHVDRSIKIIKEYGCKAGLVINPDTTIFTDLTKFMNEIDVILLMSVKPGFSGQSFIPSTLTKIKQIRKIIDDNGYSINLEVDGGINVTNIYEIANSGANIFVIGSAIFNYSRNGYKPIINAIRTELKKVY
ncbi:MAG: ribulose-phosphate 3-epimerase [Candidatus Dasytiphilus stammeri]